MKRSVTRGNTWSFALPRRGKGVSLAPEEPRTVATGEAKRNPWEHVEFCMPRRGKGVSLAPEEPWTVATGEAKRNPWEHVEFCIAPAGQRKRHAAPASKPSSAPAGQVSRERSTPRVPLRSTRGSSP